MNRLKETLKNILIVLLLLSSLCLLVLALPRSVVTRLPLPRQFSAVFGIHRQTEPPQQIPSSTLAAAATPLSISVGSTGSRHTVCRDDAALTAAYDHLSPLLSKALTTATNGTVTEPDWTEVAAQTGIVFSYGGNIPAQALCRWLTDGTTNVDSAARDFLLLADGNKVTLLLSGSNPMQYQTDVSAAALLAALETYTPDGSRLAAEEGSHLHPLTLWEQTALLPACTAESPNMEGLADTLATALDFNPYGAGTYTDPQGNTIYSETDRTLTVSADGTVSLSIHSSSLPRFTASADTPAARIETVRTLLDTIAGGQTGDARLQLTDYTGNVCRFTYVLGGIPVAPAAAEAAFDGIYLTELSVTLRNFHQAAGQTRLMPIASAAAITEADLRLTPAYSLSGAVGWSTT